ncbi:MAG: hypothetical protein DA405_10405 [Bacteroidetes bacterium]|nr:MAG: hypothetical protein DA405_10405 [Bacteroidota bacterium]
MILQIKFSFIAMMQLQRLDFSWLVALDSIEMSQLWRSEYGRINCNLQYKHNSFGSSALAVVTYKKTETSCGFSVF